MAKRILSKIMRDESNQTLVRKTDGEDVPVTQYVHQLSNTQQQEIHDVLRADGYEDIAGNSIAEFIRTERLSHLQSMQGLPDFMTFNIVSLIDYIAKHPTPKAPKRGIFDPDRRPIFHIETPISDLPEFAQIPLNRAIYGLLYARHGSKININELHENKTGRLCDIDPKFNFEDLKEFRVFRP